MSIANSLSASVDDLSQLLRDEKFLTKLRQDMLRFTELQLRDRVTAEDLVQEALTAAMRGRERFSGRAALKTWVFAILKNKIADHLRQRQHIVDIASLAGETDDDADFDILFDRRGFWMPEDRPDRWGTRKRRLPSNSSGPYLKSVSPSCPRTLPGSL